MPEDPLEPYRAWLQDSLAPVVRGWRSDAVERRYQQATDELIQRTADDEASVHYAQACPVPGVDHTHYRLRELTLDGGVSLLAGVHFRGMSTSYPFVGVFAQSRWLAANEMSRAHSALMSEFAVFSPRASWWWLPAHREVPPVPALTFDQHLVMGALEEIRKTPALPLPAGWDLRQIAATDEVSQAFADLYRSFHVARPELEQAVVATGTAALVDCAEAGGLYGCFDGSELVGLVALKADARYSVDAWLMWDIILARQHCGRGLGPVLQRATLDRLDVSHAPFIAGTINCRNLPSLCTALRVGRQIVGTWVFIRARAPGL